MQRGMRKYIAGATAGLLFFTGTATAQLDRDNIVQEYLRGSVRGMTLGSCDNSPVPEAAVFYVDIDGDDKPDISVVHRIWDGSREINPFSYFHWQTHNTYIDDDRDGIIDRIKENLPDNASPCDDMPRARK